MNDLCCYHMFCSCFLILSSYIYAASKKTIIEDIRSSEILSHLSVQEQGTLVYSNREQGSYYQKQFFYCTSHVHTSNLAMDLPNRYTHFFSQSAVRGQTAVAHADVVFTYGIRVVTPLTEVSLYEGETLHLQHCNKDSQ